MSNLSGALMGSIVGAVLGCGAWIGVGYATGYELGILAVGVGLAVGIGAGLGAKGRAGTAGGILAALVAIAAIGTARYTLLQMEITKHIAQARAEFSQEIPGPEDAEFWTAFIAERIASEREDAGETVDWPYVDEVEEGNIAATYPSDIWMEAQQAWADIPASRRDDFCATATESLLNGGESDFRMAASIVGVLLINLHPMALVIMGIAAVGAYRTAKHARPARGDDQEETIGGGQIFMDGGSSSAIAATTVGTAAATRAMPGADSTPHAAAAMPGAPATSSKPATPASAAPAKPVRTYQPAAFDESQLPPQFRTRPSNDG